MIFFGNKNQQLAKACVKGGTGLLMLQRILLPSLKLTVGGWKMNFLLGPGLFSGAFAVLPPQKDMIQNGDISLSLFVPMFRPQVPMLYLTTASQSSFDLRMVWKPTLRIFIPFPFCFVHEVIFFKIISWHTGQSC